MSATPPSAPAFARLRRSLWRRRLQQVDGPLRIQIVMLAGLVNAFLFWQTRIPFDALRRTHGPVPPALAPAAALAGALLAIAFVTAIAVALRHRRRLDEPLAGPEWLALPVPTAALTEHLAWESRARAWVGAAFAPGLLAAAVHFVPVWGLALEALGFVVTLMGASRLATRVAELARPGAPPARGDRWLSHFARVRTRPRAARLRPPRWSRPARWLTLLGKDALLARRPTAARARLVLPIVFAIASVVVWLLPFTPPVARFFAFALALGAAAAWAEFTIALAGSDRVPILRALPLAAGSLWLARAVGLACFAGALLVGNAVAARALAPAALHVYLVWLFLATLAIGLLGVHYGITLAARPELAQRFLALSLGIAMAASLMIPLLGWIVLLTSVLHSARRVPRWERIELER